MSDEVTRRWQERIVRYRQLSTLFGKHGAANPLAAIVSDLEQLRQDQQLLFAKSTEQMSYTQVLVAEIDTVLARARGAGEVAGRLLSPSLTFSADDAREESLLCCEEALATENLVGRRVLAARAAALALVAEQIDRRGSDHEPEASSAEGRRG
ncbi:MAG TPA: hypothetical protein VGP50_15800 [Stellaceae bacterium]|jgi:hypothetical protein|nr:hypothetical protein [Stellaceae bacterium]